MLISLAAVADPDRALEAFARLLDEIPAEDLALHPTALRLAGALDARRSLLDPPGDLGDRWHAVATVNAFENGHLVDRAAGIVAQLRDAGVEPLAIKGLAVVPYYGSLRDRSIGDLDMVVPAEQLDVALSTLAAAGFPCPTIPAVQRIGRHGAGMRSDDRVSFDLHWRLGRKQPITQRTLMHPGRDLWARGRDARSTGLDVPGLTVPSTADLLCIIVLHDLRLSASPSGHRAADVHRLISAGDRIDWDVVERTSASFGHRHRTSTWLRELAASFGTEVPTSILRPGRMDRRERLSEWGERFARERDPNPSTTRMVLGWTAAVSAWDLRTAPRYAIGRLASSWDLASTSEVLREAVRHRRVAAGAIPPRPHRTSGD